MTKDGRKIVIITAAVVTVLQLILIAMKECGFMDWAWGWVLAPLWMCAVASAVHIMVFVLPHWMEERLHGKD